MSFNNVRLLLKRLYLYSLFEHLLIRLAILRHLANRRRFSQHGEDDFVAGYFERKSHGLYLEIGANNPVVLSSTYLLYRMGWSGVVVDPIKRFERLFAAYRPRDRFVNAAAGPTDGRLVFYEMIPDVFSTFDSQRAHDLQKGGAILWRSYEVPIRPLSSIFVDFGGADVDFLSIDSEGYDAEILSSNDWTRFRPRLVCCEIQSHDAYFASIGYHRIAQLGVNTFYHDASGALARTRARGTR